MHPPSRKPAKRNGRRSSSRMCVIWWRSSHVLSSPPLLLHHAILRLAHEIEPALGEKIQRQRKPGQPVGQNAVVNVAAGGVVAGQRRRLLPGFAPAARVLVIDVRQCLAADEPESLHEKERQQARRDALRQIEAKAAEGLKPVGHANRADVTSLNGGAGRRGHAPDHPRRFQTSAMLGLSPP